MVAVRRPDGITLLSVLLGVMALCGLVNALVWNAPFVRELVLKASPGDADWVGGPVFTMLMLAYAASAAASASALWSLRSWAVWAYVGHTGARPEWWGNPGTANGCFKAFRFIAENKSVHGPVAWGTAGDKRPFDDERQQYCDQAIVNVGRARKAMGRTTMVSVISVLNAGTGKWVDLEVVREIKDDWPGQ